METFEHFSHLHSLTFHKSLKAVQLTCNGCNFSCTDSPTYSCHSCKFVLHEQCFHATRSLKHPLHPKHPLSLFPYPTYASRSFLCKSCKKSGSVFCYSCTTCEFDLHVHCAYNNDLKSKSKSKTIATPNTVQIKAYPNQSFNSNNDNEFLSVSEPESQSSKRKSKPKTSRPLPNTVQIKAHPDHPLRYLSNIPYNVSGSYLCDVCGTTESYGPLYHCDICGYDAHVECVDLPETVKREDHPHELSLFQLRRCKSHNCDVCRGTIARNHSIYICKSGCDYGIHVRCVTAKVTTRHVRGNLI